MIFRDPLPETLLTPAYFLTVISRHVDISPIGPRCQRDAHRSLHTFSALHSVGLHDRWLLSKMTILKILALTSKSKSCLSSTTIPLAVRAYSVFEKRTVGASGLAGSSLGGSDCQMKLLDIFLIQQESTSTSKCRAASQPTIKLQQLRDLEVVSMHLASIADIRPCPRSPGLMSQVPIDGDISFGS